jgi:hypothetical protein
VCVVCSILDCRVVSRAAQRYTDMLHVASLHSASKFTTLLLTEGCKPPLCLINYR